MMTLMESEEEYSGDTSTAAAASQSPSSSPEITPLTSQLQVHTLQRICCETTKNLAGLEETIRVSNLGPVAVKLQEKLLILITFKAHSPWHISYKTLRNFAGLETSREVSNLGTTTLKLQEKLSKHPKGLNDFAGLETSREVSNLGIATVKLQEKLPKQPKGLDNLISIVTLQEKLPNHAKGFHTIFVMGELAHVNALNSGGFTDVGVVPNALPCLDNKDLETGGLGADQDSTSDELVRSYHNSTGQLSSDARTDDKSNLRESGARIEDKSTAQSRSPAVILLIATLLATITYQVQFLMSKQESAGFTYVTFLNSVVFIASVGMTLYLLREFESTLKLLPQTAMLALFGSFMLSVKERSPIEALILLLLSISSSSLLAILCLLFNHRAKTHQKKRYV